MSHANIQCRSGLYFDFLNPHQSNILVQDIAHALSMQCRFNGHTAHFYSVAEHSVHCSHIVPPEDAFVALMHDAAEAYIGDVAKPLKNILPDYKEVEERVERALFQQLGIQYPFPDSVKIADVEMLKLEQQYAMHSTDQWHDTYQVEIPNVFLRFWSPTEARDQFLLRYEHLRSYLS